MSIISFMKFWLRCFVTLTANMRAASVLTVNRRSCISLRMFGRSASERYKNVGSSPHFFQLRLFTVFILLVAKFTYHYEAPTPPPQHASASGIKDRCCRKPRKPFSPFNRRTPVSQTSVGYVNCRRSACWLCPSECYCSGVESEILNKPQQS